MDLKVLVPCFLLFALSHGQQRPSLRSYNWRKSSSLDDWPKMSSLMPFGPHDSSSLEDMSFEFKDTGMFGLKDSSESFEGFKGNSGPFDLKDNSGSFSHETFSADFDKIPSFMGVGPVDPGLSSFENYAAQPKRTGFNLTLVRIGGFAGSGDNRGFGAYDYPKDHQFQDGSRSGNPDLEELLKIGREHQAGYPDPDGMLMHPLPPPS